MSKKNKKFLKIIWIIAGLCVGVVFFACLFSIEDPDLIFERILPTVFLVFLIALILTLLAMGMSKLGEVLGEKEYEKEKFSPTDKKNEEYYRDILKVNTPLILGVVDNYDISIENIIAELLYLKKSNIIDFVDEKIIVILDSNLELNEIHKYMIESINENGKFVFCKKRILDVTLRGAKQIKIFEKALDVTVSKDRIVKKAIVFSMMLFALIIGILGFVANGDYCGTFEVFATLAATLAAFFCLAYLRKYGVSKKSVPYIRTKEGEKLNKKIEGLKKYLKDYSLIEEKEASALELWEEYLIYSVMFGQNKKILEEYKKYIEIQD